MNEQLITLLADHALDLFLALLLGLLTRYAVPYIKAKTEAEDLVYIKQVVKDAVAAAEERFIGPKLGTSVRKPWVKALLEGMDIVVDDFIDAMIDAAARSLTATTKIVTAAATKAVEEATDGRVTAETAAGIITALEPVFTPPDPSGGPAGQV